MVNEPKAAWTALGVVQEIRGRDDPRLLSSLQDDEVFAPRVLRVDFARFRDSLPAFSVKNLAVCRIAGTATAVITSCIPARTWSTSVDEHSRREFKPGFGEVSRTRAVRFVISLADRVKCHSPSILRPV